MTGRRHLGVLAAMGLLVLAVHLPLVDRLLAPSLLAERGDGSPPRLAAVFVRELRQAAPPAPPAAPLPPPRTRRTALSPWPAASAAVLQPQDDLEPMATAGAASAPDMLTAALDEMPSAPEQPPLPVPPATTTGSGAAFEWPPSTSLSYQLTGDFRGPVDGTAQVQWVRDGERYQVHLEVAVGPSFAPLVQRRMSSDGVLTAEGLRPRRYDEETRIAFRAPRRLTVWLDDDVVRLPAGTAVPRPSGVQDTASQFVQMTWMFLLDPSRLAPGRTVEIPLALPRRVDVWTYDMIGTERLYTAAGEVEAVHLKPRREPRPGGDLTAELWIAPSLQYLPVRILIRQDPQTWVDLLINRLPRQAMPEPGAVAPVAPASSTAR